MSEQEPLNVRIGRALGDWPLDPKRCKRCGWPLSGGMCTEDSCSMRPTPDEIEPHDYVNDASMTVRMLKANMVETRTVVNSTSWYCCDKHVMGPISDDWGAAAWGWFLAAKEFGVDVVMDQANDVQGRES